MPLVFRVFFRECFHSDSFSVVLRLSLWDLPVWSGAGSSSSPIGAVFIGFLFACLAYALSTLHTHCTRTAPHWTLSRPIQYPNQTKSTLLQLLFGLYCMHVCMYMYVCIHVHTPVCTCTYVYMYVHLYVHVRMYTCTCVRHWMFLLCN